jgi:hypothetical protein
MDRPFFDCGRQAAPVVVMDPHPEAARPFGRHLAYARHLQHAKAFAGDLTAHHEGR